MEETFLEVAIQLGPLLMIYFHQEFYWSMTFLKFIFLVGPLPRTEVTLPRHTPSSYSGSSTRWNAELAARQHHSGVVIILKPLSIPIKQRPLHSPPHRGLWRLLQEPSADRQGRAGSQGPPAQWPHHITQRHASRVTCHVSRVTCHGVTCHVSRVTRHECAGPRSGHD